MGGDQSKSNLENKGRETMGETFASSASLLQRARSPSSASLRSEPGFLFSSLHQDGGADMPQQEHGSNIPGQYSGDVFDPSGQSSVPSLSQSFFRVPRSLTHAAGSVGFTRDSSQSIHKGRRVIVVKPKEGSNAERRTDGQLELNRLSSIPRFLPIIRHSVAMSDSSSSLSNPTSPLVTLHTMASDFSHSSVSASIGSPVAGPHSSLRTVAEGGSAVYGYTLANTSHRGTSTSGGSKRNSLPLGGSLADGIVPPGRVDFRGVLHFSARYQEHLKQCAEVVSFEQNTLCVAMKAVSCIGHEVFTHIYFNSAIQTDSQAQQLANALAERQRKHARLMELLHKVGEMKRVLTRMRSSADWLAITLNQLNESLPPELQLETFTSSPKAMSTEVNTQGDREVLMSSTESGVSASGLIPSEDAPRTEEVIAS